MGNENRKFRRFRVIPQEEGQTLQILLARRLPGVDRERAAAIVKAGGVYVNKLRVRLPMVRVVAGERITVYPEADAIEEFPLDELVFVHRDEDFVVLEKPVGVPVAQTQQSAHGTLARALRRQLEAEGRVRPYVGVVHRLDLGASGLVLFTIRDVANKSLHQQFKEHTISREYRLEVHGHPREDAFTVDAGLRLGARTVKVAEPGDPKAAFARTHFRCLERREGPRALLEAKLETGRTHQIRAHISHLGHPIVGDARYGEDEGDAGLRLHALRLRFDHPRSGETVEIVGQAPDWARASDDSAT